MIKAKWLLHKHMLDLAHVDIISSFNKFNIDYQIIDYDPCLNLFKSNDNPFDQELKYENGDCVIAYGTLEFLNAIKKCNKQFIPSAYIQDKQLDCLYYINKLPNNSYLNNNFIMLPYAELKAQPQRIYDMFEEDTIFVRPNSGYKTFTGVTISKDDFNYEIQTLDSLTSVVDETLILISPIKNIKKEYRVVIGNHEVLDYSLYRENGENEIRKEKNTLVEELAFKMSKNYWQPDLVYTCDIAILDDGTAKIIELNSFSGAGFYACDPDILIPSISNIAELEFIGEIYLEN